MKFQIIFSLIGVLFFCACREDVKQQSHINDLPKMTQYQKDQRNKDIILNCIRAFKAKDIEYILAQNANDIVNIYEGRPPIYGTDSARIILQQFFEMLKDYEPSNQVALAENNYVFVFQYIDISNTKNDDRYHAKQVEIFKFNDEGKIILHTGVGESMEPNYVRISF